MTKQLVPTILFVAVLGTGMTTHVAAEETPHLPRAFQKAHLGMGIVEFNGIQPGHRRTGATQAASIIHLVERPKDPYVRRVEYDFYNGRLAEITINYKSDRLKGKVEAFINRLKQTYGNPQAAEGPQLAVAGEVYAETKTHWSDAQTDVTLIERDRQAEDDPEFILVLTDRALCREKEIAMKRQKEEEAFEIPIPVPSSPNVRLRTGIPDAPGNTTSDGFRLSSLPADHSS
jgi:hypothetical protein